MRTALYYESERNLYLQSRGDLSRRERMKKKTSCERMKQNKMQELKEEKVNKNWLIKKNNGGKDQEKLKNNEKKTR